MMAKPMTADEALAFAVQDCAMRGTGWAIFNSNRDLVWEIEADTKVDDEDLTFPVIVHMRGGTLPSGHIALVQEVVA